MSIRTRNLALGAVVAVVALVLPLVVVTMISRQGDESVPLVHPSSHTACLAQGRVGIAGGSELTWMPPEELDRELRSMRAMGATWLRVGIDWSLVEQIPGRYDWTSTDRVLDRALAQGYSILAVVLGTPRWARNSSALDSQHAIPADPNRFGGFVQVAAKRYVNRITNWEIGNEPNIVSFAKPRPSVDTYHRMLVAASNAVRAQAGGRQVTIVTAGLAPAGSDGVNVAPVDFVARLYELGNSSVWDAVGVHPYTYPALPLDPSAASWSAFAQLPRIRGIMDRHGDRAKNIWLTEFGAPTGGGSRAVTPEMQALTIEQGLTEATAARRYGPVFIHSSRDRGVDPFDVEDHFGVLYLNFTPKPAYNRIKQLTTC